MTMLKIYCALTGDNFKMVSTDTPQSRQKVALLAWCLMIPVIFWAYNGFLLTHVVLGKSLPVSIFMSVFCALVVYILERVIIQSPNDPRIKRQRILIGVCTAILGAIAFDEVVFEGDIQHQLEINRNAVAVKEGQRAGIKFDSLHQMSARYLLVQTLKSDYDNSVQAVKDEMDGRGSVKGAGVGRVTREKQAISAAALKKWEKADAEYNDLVSKKEQEVQTATDAAKAEKNEGLITRVSALFQLVFSNGVMALYFIIFTGLMFFLEFIVILVKSATPETSYERKLRMIEEISRKRMEMMMAFGAPAVSADYVLPNAVAARVALNKKDDSLLN